MANIGSVARRSAGVRPGQVTAERLAAERRRVGAARRPPRRGRVAARLGSATRGPGTAWFAEEADDGIDPAFDEFGDLAHHVDGLATRMMDDGRHAEGDGSWIDD